jgi:hypothetical protein
VDADECNFVCVVHCCALCYALFPDTQLINELQLIVRSEGAEDNVYLVSITRSSLVSQNANLLTLAWRAANGSAVDEAALVSSMEPAFSSQIFEYVVQLAPGVSDFSVSGTVEAQATLTWATNRTSVGRPETELDSTTPAVLASGVASPALTLAAGQRLKLLLHVLAEDGINVRDYTFSIRRADDTAQSASSSSGDGSPDLSSTGLDLNAATTHSSAATMATGESNMQKAASAVFGRRKFGGVSPFCFSRRLLCLWVDAVPNFPALALAVATVALATGL